MKITLRFIVLFLIIAPWLWGCGSMVAPGKMGLKWRPLTTGLSEQPLHEGFYLHMPWNDVLTYSVQWQRFTEKVDALTRDDLHIQVEASLVARPLASELNQLQLEIGPDFYPTIVKPEFLTVLRSTVADYVMVEIPEKSQEIEDKVYQRLKERIKGKHLEVDNITVDHMDFTAGVLLAIESKLAKEQEVIQKESELAIAVKEAEIARVRAQGEGDALMIRAQGEAEAQKTIAKTLTPRFLQFKAFDSPNTKFIYVPIGKDGLPLIVSPEVR